MATCEAPGNPSCKVTCSAGCMAKCCPCKTACSGSAAWEAIANDEHFALQISDMPVREVARILAASLPPATLQALSGSDAKISGSWEKTNLPELARALIVAR